MEISVKVNNLPEDKAENYRWLVLSTIDGEFWYYGADHDKSHAETIAHNLDDKVVVRNPYYKG